MTSFFEDKLPVTDALRLDYKELYYITHENINNLYLEHGGLKEILEMSYWRYLSLMDTVRTRNAGKHGKPVGHSQIFKSQQDMINKTKELNK